MQLMKMKMLHEWAIKHTSPHDQASVVINSGPLLAAVDIDLGGQRYVKFSWKAIPMELHDPLKHGHAVELLLDPHMLMSSVGRKED